VTVAVHVADARDGRTELVAGRLTGAGQQQLAGRAGVHVHPAGTRRAVADERRHAGRADDDIGRAVGVDAHER
jgi:hypothetical protein